MREATTPEEQAYRQTEIRRSQAGMFSLESDKSRLQHKHNDLMAEIHRMQVERSHLEMSLKEKEAALFSLERKIELVNEEIVRAKKHMNTL